MLSVSQSPAAAKKSDHFRVGCSAMVRFEMGMGQGASDGRRDVCWLWITLWEGLLRPSLAGELEPSGAFASPAARNSGRQTFQSLDGRFWPVGDCRVWSADIEIAAAHAASPADQITTFRDGNVDGRFLQNLSYTSRNRYGSDAPYI